MVLFTDVSYGRYTMLQGTASYPRVFGKHKLDLIGLKLKNMARIWEYSGWGGPRNCWFREGGKDHQNILHKIIR